MNNRRYQLIVFITLFGILSGLSGYYLYSSIEPDSAPILPTQPQATAAAQIEPTPELPPLSRPVDEEPGVKDGVKDKPAPLPEKIAYLTFDDGPSPEVTPLILATLKKYEVKATFFVVGWEVEAYPELARAIIEQGHALGNHTYSHQYARIYQSPQAFVDDLVHAEKIINEITGIKPRIMRAPGGSNAFLTAEYVRLLNNLGYVYYDWNVSSCDAALGGNIPAPDIVRNVLSQSSQNKTAIILMHDASDKLSTAAALPEIIEGLKRQGFSFQVLTPAVKPVQFPLRPDHTVKKNETH